ncbi:MAG: hypothetical protein ACQETH_03345 [Candidatus Rifleibacteriota bacterium]
MLNNKRKQQFFKFLLVIKPLFIAIMVGLFFISPASPGFAQVTIVAPPPVVKEKNNSATPVPEQKKQKAAEEKIHFYSDPAPLIRKTKSSMNFDLELFKLEQAKDFPRIDAPAGLYDFSYSDKNFKIIASHSLKEKEIKPGQTIGLDFMVSNLTSRGYRLKQEIIAHEKIRAAHERTSFLLEPGKKTNRHIALFLDSSLPPGIYQIVYRLNSTAGNTLSETVKFKFAVKAFPCLKFKRTSSAQITENSLFKVTGELHNCGNLDLYLDLAIGGNANNLEVVPSRISLPAGSNCYLEISGKSPALLHPMKNVLKLNFSATARTSKRNFELLNKPIKLILGASP